MTAGTSLRQLAGTPMPAYRALVIARRILEALAGADAAPRVVPERITLLADDVVVLEPPLPADSDAFEPYRAPELDRGPGDGRADLYAVGAVLYELLTGRPPFVGRERDALRRLHAYAPPQPLARTAPQRSFAPELEAVVATALAKVPGRRYASARDMIAAIDAAIAALPATARLETVEAELEPDADEPEPRASAHDSLVMYAQALAQQRAAEPPTPPRLFDEPPRPAPVPLPREEPPMPAAWPPAPMLPDDEAPLAPAQTSPMARVLGWLTATTGWPRRRVLVALAALAGLVVVTVLALVLSSGPSDPRSATASAPPSAPDAALALADAAPSIDLQQRCEQLGVTCGELPKHEARIASDCKGVAVELVAHGCTELAAAVFDCYEADVCNGSEKVWAYSDLNVLAARRGACASQWAALDGCLAK